MLGCAILLIRVATPGVFHNESTEVRCQFHCAVHRTAVEHHDLVAAPQAFDRPRDVALLVQSDDRRRDLHEARSTFSSSGAGVKHSRNIRSVSQANFFRPGPMLAGSTITGWRRPKYNSTAQTSHPRQKPIPSATSNPRKIHVSSL